MEDFQSSLADLLHAKEKNLDRKTTHISVNSYRTDRNQEPTYPLLTISFSAAAVTQ